MTTVLVLLIVALASVGVGYALWSKTLHINGTVATGNVNAIFTKAFTDDDNGVDDGSLDSTDLDNCIGQPGGKFGTGSCDPAASGHNVLRKDKDVGICQAEITEEDDQIIEVTIDNAYPSYYCTVFFSFKNTGSIPVKIFTLAAVGPAITAGHVTAHWTDLQGVGQQIDPGATVSGDLDLHVNQSSPQGETLVLYGKIQLWQWNEFIPLNWQKCAGGAAPCNEAPEVVFDGNTVVMGQIGEGEGGQESTSVHGGAALLPPASSYDVTFQYHVCTWDAYNAFVGGGTGYWDSFSVSVSDKPFWQKGYTDPLPLPFVWGGNLFGDHVLDCNDDTQTINFPGNPLGNNYLNAVLDTGSLPEANHNYPSYGTITIEKIVVNP
jgi:hypothetical protein